VASPDQDKWDRIYREAADGDVPAAAVLRDNRHLLPRRGSALDLACGRGGNALLLAAAGLETHAWDLSVVAVEDLSARAARRSLALHAVQRDACAAPPAPDSFDVIAVSHFLDRQLCPALAAALRDNGLLFYQTFTEDKDPDVGPKNPDYILRRGELLTLFAGLRPVLYREEGRLGDLTQGFRNEAILVARKD